MLGVITEFRLMTGLCLLAEIADKMGTPAEAFIVGCIAAGVLFLPGLLRWWLGFLPGLAVCVCGIYLNYYGDPDLGNWWERELDYDWPRAVSVAWSIPFCLSWIVLAVTMAIKRKRSLALSGDAPALPGQKLP